MAAYHKWSAVMTMKLLVLKDSGDYKAGYEGFVPRPIGKKMCQEKTAVPWSMRDRISKADVKALKQVEADAKRAAKKKAKEEKAKEEKAKGDELLKESLKPKAETAFSKRKKYKY
jgi:hypothetical protein